MSSIQGVGVVVLQLHGSMFGEWGMGHCEQSGVGVVGVGHWEQSGEVVGQEEVGHWVGNEEVVGNSLAGNKSRMP